MKDDRMDQIVFLMLIIARKQKDDVLCALSELGAKVINTSYGKGTVKAGYLENVFGLIPEENKAVITSLLSRETSNAVFKILVEKFDFEKPNTGIAFTIPVDRLSF